MELERDLDVENESGHTNATTNVSDVDTIADRLKDIVTDSETKEKKGILTVSCKKFFVYKFDLTKFFFLQ